MSKTIDKSIDKLKQIKETQMKDQKYTIHNSGILVDRYCLLKTIDEGGTAIVKLAYDLKTHELCAVKIMFNLSEKELKMLFAEVTAMS